MSDGAQREMTHDELLARLSRYRKALETIAETPGYGSLGTSGLHALARIALATPQDEWVELTSTLRIKKDGSEWEQMPEDHSDPSYRVEGYRAALADTSHKERTSKLSALLRLADFIAALWDGLEMDLTRSHYFISPNTKARVDGLIAALKAGDNA